jgi:hypothetical protein
VEFESKLVNTSFWNFTAASKPSNNTDKRNSSPMVGLPKRTQIFRGDTGGNQVQNGNITASG